MKRRPFACTLAFVISIATARAVVAQPAAEPSPSAASTPFPVPAGAVEPFRGPATVAFVATDPLPLVAATVNGHDGLFLIDTGAGDLVVDPDFAAEAGIALSAAGSGTFGGGKRAPIARGQATRVSVGPLAIDGMPVIGVPTRANPFFPGRRVDGIIGTALLAHVLATIDYVRGALVLRPRSDSAAFERAAAERGATVVPMAVFPDHFLFVRGRVNDGPEGLLNVDTGLAGGGVMVSKAALADSHVVLDEAHAGQGMGGGGSVKIVPFSATVSVGGRRVAGVNGFFTPEGDQFGIFPFPVRGTVSHGYFRTCALTFDFDAMLLVMQ